MDYARGGESAIEMKTIYSKDGREDSFAPQCALNLIYLYGESDVS